LTRRTLSIAPAQAIIKKTAMRFPHAGNHVRAWNMMRFNIRNVAGMFMMRAFGGHQGSPSKTRIPRDGHRALIAA